MDFIEKTQDIHIGNIIQAKLIEKSMTITEFADRINKDRTTAHNIFTRKSIDTELLIRISKALEYDFIRNVYYGEEIYTTVFIAIKTNENEIKKMNLPEDFIRLAKPLK